jgi:hypothetical protein
MTDANDKSDEDEFSRAAELWEDADKCLEMMGERASLFSDECSAFSAAKRGVGFGKCRNTDELAVSLAYNGFSSLMAGLRSLIHHTDRTNELLTCILNRLPVPSDDD